MNKFSLFTAVLVFGSSVALANADCQAPASPELPVGATSTKEQMLEGQKAVKAFQAANLDYMKCLEGVFTEAEELVKQGEAKDPAAAQAAYQQAVDAYNSAVSAEETVAGQFNTAIREYKAANAK